LLPANGVGEATSEGLWTSFLGQVIPAGSNILNGQATPTRQKLIHHQKVMAIIHLPFRSHRSITP
jgi:hypothetical protein